MTATHHWLLLRGLVREQRHWNTFPSLFEAAMEGHVTHCLDLPGVGTEHQRPALWTIDAHVDDLRRRWLLHRDTQENAGSDAGAGKWSLLSISLGGMIGLRWTERFPDDFAHHVVTNTSAADLGLPWRRMRWAALPHVMRALLTRNPEAREHSVLRATTQLQSATDATAKQWAALARETPPYPRTFWRQMVAAARYRSPADMKVPTLVLSSLGDGMVDPACSRKLAQKLDLGHREHSTAGHDLPLDAPTWMLEQIAQWLPSREMS